MPLSKYNAAFGGKKGSAAKAMAAMREQYGEEKGRQVFYATKNKRSRRGREPRDRRQALVHEFQQRMKGHGSAKR
jgi:hypothetical protein